MTTSIFKVSGMTCGACVRHVTAALQALEGVERVEVDLAAGQVRVEGPADHRNLIAALDDAGYPAEVISDTVTPAAPRSGCGGSGGCCCS